MMILRDMPVVIIGQSQVKQDAQDKRKVEEDIVQTILCLKQVLNVPVDTEYP